MKIDNIKKGLSGLSVNTPETADIYARLSFIRDRDRKKKEKQFNEIKNKERLEAFKGPDKQNSGPQDQLIAFDNFKRQRNSIEFSSYMQRKYP